MKLSILQKILPSKLKYFLKPFYRKFFPNAMHAVFWITFRCNYQCSYCYINTKFNYSSIFNKKCEKTPEEWLKTLENLPPTKFYFSGGEPFLYKGFDKLINEMPSKHEILGVVTNASLRVEEYKKIKKKIHLNISFHREFTSEDEFVKKVVALKDYFHVAVNIVATPKNLPFIETFKKIAEKYKIHLHVDPYVDFDFKYTDGQLKMLSKYIQKDRNPEKHLNFEDYSTKKCSAGKNYFNLLPNGEAFSCAGGMNYNYVDLQKKLIKDNKIDHFRLGNVFDNDFKFNEKNIVCSLPCKEPCDIDSVAIEKI